MGKKNGKKANKAAANGNAGARTDKQNGVTSEPVGKPAVDVPKDPETIETKEEVGSNEAPKEESKDSEEAEDKEAVINSNDSIDNQKEAEHPPLKAGISENNEEDLQAQLEQMELERDEIQEEYDNLLEKVSLIKQKLGDRFKVLESEAESAKKEAENATKEAENARKEAEVSKRDVEVTKKELEAVKKEIESTNQASETIKKQAESSQKEIDALKNQINRLEKESAEAKTESSALKSQLVSQKIMFDQEVLNERLNRENLEVEISQLHANLGDTETVALQSAQTNDAQEKEIIYLRAELQRLKTQNETEGSESRAIIERLERERDLLQQELLASKNQLADFAKSSQGSVEVQKKLETEARENQLLIGKLRHEAVILNDHLTQALRMIRKDSEGSTVDKELVSNLFVQYATCPRQDTKKFEILQLIANFLDWDEPRRQTVGLLRSDEISAEIAELPPTQMVGFVGRLAEYLESKRGVRQ